MKKLGLPPTKYGSKAGLFEKAIQHRLADTPLNKVLYSGDLEADLLAIVKAYIETNETYGDIIPIILLELPRNLDLPGAINTPLNNLQAVIKIIQKYQEQGLLMGEAPLSTISALMGPVMIHQLFRHANLNLPIPLIDPQAHVHAFLTGRKQ